ncbi:MAG: histidine kinase, partial [Cytophagaceae bacterium]
MNLMRIQLRDETDLVNCRQRARQIAHMFQLDQLQQTQFATAVSEIARNALRFAAGGKVIFSLKNDAPLTLLVTVEDQGPGIADVESVIATTQGMGLKGCYRLMDSCKIHSELGLGTTVTLGKLLQAREPFSP